MQEKEIAIKVIHATVDSTNTYAIEVDETTLFKEFKEILNGATHLLKGSYKIFNEQEELGNQFDQFSLQKIFQERNPINFQFLEIINQNLKKN